jgi:hypothetical protein
MAEPQTELERRVVGALILPPDAPVTDRTVAAIAARAGLTEREVRRTLEQLESLDGSPVHRDRDAKLDIEIWWAIEPGASDLLDDVDA